MLALACVWVASEPAAQDIGYEGPSFQGAGSTPTEAKPQSKLWYADGIWWGSLWSVSAQAFRVHRLDFTTHDWIDTGVVIDTRPNSHSDTLWDGTRLYVVTHEFSLSGGAQGNPIRVLRYSYDPATDGYALDAGFPIAVGNVSTEAVVIEKDSQGTLWVAWTDALRARITHTLGSDTQWSTPAIVPTNTTNLLPDDICSLIRFGGKIGVLWSDQATAGFFFSFHVDGAADTAWSPPEFAGGFADDHIHLASDAAGRVLAAVKDGNDQVVLLLRDGSGWRQFVAWQSVPIHTRPFILLDEQARIIHLFTTGQDSGEVFEKVSSLDNISFPTGEGTIVMRDGTQTFRISDPTSTKQGINATKGLVVLAHHDTTGFYWHHEVPPGGGGGAPSANFVGAPLSGQAPLTVQFTDASAGQITSRQWSFGDGGTSTDTSPAHTYGAGTYTVSLTVSGPGGSDTETKTGFVVVTSAAPVADFTASPRSGTESLTVQFTDASAGNITSRFWNFGDGATSNGANPAHVYGAGTYTVSLTVSGPTGTDTETKVGYIVVTAAPPVANFTGFPTYGQEPLSVQFTDASTGTVSSRLWDFGDGATSNAKDPSHVYGPGSYTVSLRLDGPGGSDTETKTGYIVVTAVPPAADFSASPQTGAAPLTVQFTDKSTGNITGRLWDFGDGATSNAKDPSHVYGPGSYTVSLSVTGPGGADTETRIGYIVVAHSPPTANFSATPRTGAAPLTVQFTDASTGLVTARQWDFGDGGTSTATDPTHTFAPGSFTVALTVSGPTGSSTETKFNYVVVSGGPTANFSASPRSGQAPLTVQFTDASAGSIQSWLWDFGDGSTSNAASPAHTFVPGSFTVSLTVSGPNGSATETKPAFVVVTVPPPAADFTASPQSGPAPLTVQFTDASSGSIRSWLWDFGDGATSNARYPLHTYAAGGTYTVMLTVTGAGGSDTKTKAGFVTVSQPPSNLVLLAPIPGTVGANLITVTGATPGSTVDFYSDAAQGSSPVFLASCPNGVPTGLASPTFLASTQADALGMATITFFVPITRVGSTLLFQAVDESTCQASNLVSALF